MNSVQANVVTVLLLLFLRGKKVSLSYLCWILPLVSLVLQFTNKSPFNTPLFTNPRLTIIILIHTVNITHHTVLLPFSVG